MKSILMQIFSICLIITIMSCGSKSYKMLPPSDDCKKLLKNLGRLLSEPDSIGIYGINWELIDTNEISPALYVAKNNDSILAAVGVFDNFSEKALKSYFGVYKQFYFFKECLYKKNSIKKEDIIKYLGKPTFVVPRTNTFFYKLNYSNVLGCPNLEEKLIENKCANCNFVRFDFDENGIIEHITVSIECCSEDIGKRGY